MTNTISMPLAALALPGADGQPGPTPAVGDTVDLTAKVAAIDGDNATLEVQGAENEQAEQPAAAPDEAALRKMAADDNGDRDAAY